VQLRGEGAGGGGRSGRGNVEVQGASGATQLLQRIIRGGGLQRRRRDGLGRACTQTSDDRTRTEQAHAGSQASSHAQRVESECMSCASQPSSHPSRPIRVHAHDRRMRMMAVPSRMAAGRSVGSTRVARVLSARSLISLSSPAVVLAAPDSWLLDMASREGGGRSSEHERRVWAGVWGVGSGLGRRRGEARRGRRKIGSGAEPKSDPASPSRGGVDGSGTGERSIAASGPSRLPFSSTHSPVTSLQAVRCGWLSTRRGGEAEKLKKTKS